MRRELVEKVIALGGDPTDQVWHWILLRGPHGPSFTWGQSRTEPAGYVGVEHLQTIVGDMASSDASFLTKVTAVAHMALASSMPSVVRRGIQVLSVVGARPDLTAIVALKGHEDSTVSADARAGEFYLKRRLADARN